jgi:heparanase 1
VGIRFRALLVFGLNAALYVKSILHNGSAVGAWNSSKAESFIRSTVKKNYIIYGWELGKDYLLYLFPI